VGRAIRASPRPPSASPRRRAPTSSVRPVQPAQVTPLHD
jgi:hypothetical protein